MFAVQQIIKLDPGVLLDLREGEEGNTLLHRFVRFASALLHCLDPTGIRFLLGEPFPELVVRIAAIMNAFPKTEAVHFATNLSGKMPYELASAHIRRLLRKPALELIQKRAHIKKLEWPGQVKGVEQADTDLSSASVPASSSRLPTTNEPVDESAHSQRSPADSDGGSKKKKKKKKQEAADGKKDRPLSDSTLASTRTPTVARAQQSSSWPVSTSGAVASEQQEAPEEQDECASCEAYLASAVSDAVAPLEAVANVLRVVRASEAHESESHRSLARRALQRLVHLCQTRHRDVLAAARDAASSSLSSTAGVHTAHSEI